MARQLRSRRKAAKSDAAAVTAPAPRKESIANATPNGAALGLKLRVEREKRSISVREMARRVAVSPSLISQIERGLVTPSVGTLWAMTTELGLVMDQLFRNTEHPASLTGHSADETVRRAQDFVQRGSDRKRIRLAGGVEWERLTAQADDEVEFLYVRYGPGAESCPEDSFVRHGGKEYAYILEGRLGVQIGFERYELAPGDSVSFNSRHPHRLWTIGNKPALAIWVIINRADDARD
jgi:transcriptional regulator with XRE-family HTH domain